MMVLFNCKEFRRYVRPFWRNTGVS